MRKNWNLLIVVVLLMGIPMLGGWVRPSAIGMKDSLSGKWSIDLTPDDDARHAGEREMKDTITFKQAMFSSEALAKRGFEPVLYEEEMHPGGAGRFTALQTNKNAAEGTANWSGTITATEVTGDLVIKKKDGTVLNFAFTGSKE